VNSIFCFAPDGKIKICTINCPGSWHDSTQADYGVYKKLEDVYDRTGGKIVVDSAFQFQVKDYLIKSSQEDPVLNDATEEESALAIVINSQATGLRQLSEWGMRMIEGQFPRLKDNCQLEDYGERKVILHLMVMLYNYQTSKVGLNQIMNVFMSKTPGFQSYNTTLSEDGNGILYWN